MAWAVVVLLMGAWSWAAQPAEWPQWQGPNRDNLSTDTGLLQKWPEAGPPLAWKQTGLGRGYSSVAIAGGHIYTMGDIDGNACIIALDMTGKHLWSAKIGPAAPDGKNYPGTRATPTVDGQVVFGLSQMGDLGCVNVADGSIVWTKNLIKDFQGEMMSSWGYSESVLVDGDNVICMPGGDAGAFLALNKKDGQQVWRNAKNTDKASYSSFVLATICGQKQYVKLTAKSLLAL
jgi:outer membrane protein assembly factor BamB